MFRSRWLHNLLGLTYSHECRRRRAARPRCGVRLTLESLEARLTPSTVIENAADAATLQTDLNNATAANTQYIINLNGASSAYNLATGQELTISAAASGSSVTIMGAGQSITGNGNRVFFIDPGASVTLQNLTITSGSSVTKGGGVYVSGASTVAIINSIISDNSVQNTSGSASKHSGPALGGGLYVAGSGWTVTLTGDTLSGNTVLSGYAGTAEGGAAYFSAGGSGSDHLTILNNLSAPISDPSIMINNYVHAGADGHGGFAAGGAIYIGGASGASLTANIGNTAFYSNLANGGNGGTAEGGGVYLGGGNVTMVNCTVASNKSGIDTNGKPGTTSGGGIYDADTAAVTLDNNTIHANTLNSQFNSGKGVFVAAGNPTLLNNLIRGNYTTNSAAQDLDTNGITLSNATNNSVGFNSANALNPTTNIITSQIEMGGTVGVTANGVAGSGGPIYYPLLSGALSIGTGTTRVLNTIAAVEGTTPANAVDALGNHLSANGPIDIGAVQVVLPPHHSPPPQQPPHHSWPPSPPYQASSPIQAIISELESLLSSIEAELNVLLEIIESILR